MTLHWTLALAIGATLPQCIPTAELRATTQHMPMKPFPHPQLSDFGLETWPLLTWYEAIEGANDFRVLESFPQVLAEEKDVSEINCMLFLQPPFVPHQQPQGSVAWAINVAAPGGVDLLRAIYTTENFRVRFYANVNFSRLDLVPLDSSPYALDNPQAVLAHVKESIVLAHAPPLQDWNFVIPDNVTLPIRVTNVGAPEVAQIRSRHDRLDIMMSKDAVHIQYYNKIHQYLNYLPADQWFNADARRLFGRNPRSFVEGN